MRVYEARKPRIFRALQSFGCCPIQSAPAGTPIAHSLEYTFSGVLQKTPVSGAIETLVTTKRIGVKWLSKVINDGDLEVQLYPQKGWQLTSHEGYTWGA
jgi:hypothetical protein